MRFRPALPIAVAVLFTAMIPTPALAGMPLPCTGDRSIKVNETGIKLKNGTTVFLGYMYQGCVTGQWIGYLDGRRYLPLKTPEAATALALASGLTGLPQPPNQLAHPFVFWVEWVWGLVIAFVVSGTAVSAWANSSDGRRLPAPA